MKVSGNPPTLSGVMWREEAMPYNYSTKKENLGHLERTVGGPGVMSMKLFT